jgi:hypothetical protein
MPAHQLEAQNMVMPTIAAELTKLAVTKLAEIRPDDVARAARAVGRAAGAGSMLIPGLGVFGAGLLLGTGIGMLTAPRTGRETRERLIGGLRQRLARFSKKRELTRVSSSNGGPTLSES